MNSVTNAISSVRGSLEDALHEGRMSGLAAVKKFVASSKLSPEGLVVDTCGRAHLKVFKPSYHFREALKQIYPDARAHRAAWMVLGFGQEIDGEAGQSITAHELACSTALEILKAKFPAENFMVSSYVD